MNNQFLISDVPQCAFCNPLMDELDRINSDCALILNTEIIKEKPFSTNSMMECLCQLQKRPNGMELRCNLYSYSYRITYESTSKIFVLLAYDDNRYEILRFYKEYPEDMILDCAIYLLEVSDSEWYMTSTSEGK